jgi:hypothetical protein
MTECSGQLAPSIIHPSAISTSSSCTIHSLLPKVSTLHLHTSTLVSYLTVPESPPSTPPATALPAPLETSSSAFAEPHQMPSVLPSRSRHTFTTSQGDMDVLDMLTSGSRSLEPLSMAPSHSHPHKGSEPKKGLPRREGPIDPLMISAVLAGSAPITRHHFGHGLSESIV